MNKEQFDKLKGIEKAKEQVITIDDLINKTNRTLLYGYTCERDTWHVYIKDNKIFAVIYKYGESPKEMNIFSNYCYIPDKRLYPETCDYEFCKLLKDKEIDLPFTTWQDRPEKQYYGELL